MTNLFMSDMPNDAHRDQPVNNRKHNRIECNIYGNIIKCHLNYECELLKYEYSNQNWQINDNNSIFVDNQNLILSMSVQDMSKLKKNYWF